MRQTKDLNITHLLEFRDSPASLNSYSNDLLSWKNKLYWLTTALLINFYIFLTCDVTRSIRAQMLSLFNTTHNNFSLCHHTNCLLQETFRSNGQTKVFNFTLWKAFSYKAVSSEEESSLQPFLCLALVLST